MVAAYDLGCTHTLRSGKVISVPDDLVCPISQEMMKNPMKLPCGHGFDGDYPGNLDWIKTGNGCPLCRHKCTVDKLTVDREKYKRIKAITDQDIPVGWQEKIKSFFENRFIALKQITPIIFNDCPKLAVSMNYISSPVYGKIIDINTGKSNQLGFSPLQAEIRFAKTVVLGVAAIVRDLALSFFLFCSWAVSAYVLNGMFGLNITNHDMLASLLTKRVGLLASSSIYFVTLCYWQSVNRSVYMRLKPNEAYRDEGSLNAIEGYERYIREVSSKVTARLTEVLISN